jgi:SAM-dependent methyltransferase
MNPYVVTLAACPACGSRQLAPLYRNERPLSTTQHNPDRYLFEEMGVAALPIVYDLCRACGLLFLNPRWNDAGLQRLYGPDDIYRRAAIRAEHSGQHTDALYQQTVNEIDPSIADPSYLDPNVGREVAWMQDQAPLLREKGRLVADIGAGWGRAQAVLERGGFKYIGFDSAPRLVSLAKDAGRNVECVPFADLGRALREEADVLFTHHFLEHVDRPGECLQSLRGCLKDGGYLFVAVPTFHFFTSRCVGGIDTQLMTYPAGARLSMNWGHMSHFYHASLGNLFIRTGFEPVSYAYFKMNIFMLGRKVELGQVQARPEPPNPWRIAMNVRVFSPALTRLQPMYFAAMRRYLSMKKRLGSASGPARGADR